MVDIVKISLGIDPRFPRAAIAAPPNPFTPTPKLIAVGGGEGGSTDQFITRTAAANIGAPRAVYVDSSNKFALADPANPLAAAACGVTIGAAAINTSLTAQISGEMTEPAWAWAAGPVFIGAGGVLTQNPVSSGTLVQIGVATGPNTLIIDPEHISNFN